MKRKMISQELKQSLLKESDFKCSVCGAQNFLELHHIQPISLGGENSPDNLIVLCPTCHMAVDRANINSDLLKRIKLRWTEKHINGREDIISLNEQIRRDHGERSALYIKRSVIAHELGHWALALTRYKDFDTHIERIASELENISGEDEFLERILKPLFDALGFEGVTVFHHTGKTERGKDLVFYDRDRFGSLTFYAVVATAKKIHTNSSRTHDSGHYQKILDQVSKCFLFPHKEPNLKGSFFIDKVVIASASTITEEAMESFTLWEASNRRHLIYLSGPDIAGMRLKLSVDPLKA